MVITPIPVNEEQSAQFCKYDSPSKILSSVGRRRRRGRMPVPGGAQRRKKYSSMGRIQSQSARTTNILMLMSEGAWHQGQALSASLYRGKPAYLLAPASSYRTPVSWRFEFQVYLTLGTFYGTSFIFEWKQWRKNELNYATQGHIVPWGRLLPT